MVNETFARRVSQNDEPRLEKAKWWARQDSNLGQHRYERCVLTAELQARRISSRCACVHRRSI